MNKLKEDTVSADRKERIIFDPDAWRKSDKSGKKTSAITSRQNFDNEKFTRKSDKQVDEGALQPSGDSKVDSAGPTQSDMISKDTKPKKSNNPQIEFVTGTATPNGSSSTAQGNQPMTGRKIAEALVKKAMKKVKTCSEEVEQIDDTERTKTAKTMDNREKGIGSAVNRLAEGGQYAGLEKEDKPGKKSTEFKGSKNAITGKTVEGWKDEKVPVKEEAEQVDEGIGGAIAGGLLGAALGPIGVAAGAYLGHKTQQGADASKSVKKKVNKEENDMSLNKEGWDPEQFGSDGSGAGRPGGAGAGDIGKTDKKKKSAKPMKEGKTYSQFMEELDQLVEFVVEENQLNEYNAKDGVYRHKGTYGGGYVDPEGADDADDKPKAAAVKTPGKRGNPGTPRGSYKARSAETKAAAAAKSAASKAANKAK